MSKVNLKFATGLLIALVAAQSVFAQAPARGQGAGGRGGSGQTPPEPPPTPRAAAPIDLTGNWVSVITEDWRWRMVTPPKGDYASIPINAEAKKVADAWDAAKDIAAGDQCKAYGAPGLMRLPTRLRISWQDDTTLKIETDAGQQTRLFYFGTPPPATGEDFQGSSKAEWDAGNSGAGGLFFGRGGGSEPAGSLKVVTTRMKPGYATRNGVPYSAGATLTEYFDLVKTKSGVEYLVLTSTLEDPTFMSQPMWTAVHFKKQPDANGFKPVACGGK